MIELKNVMKRYQEKCVLSVDGLIIKRGERVGIIGESGSGKTTLGAIILGLIQPTSGQVNIQANSKLPIFQNPYESFNAKLKLRTSMHQALKSNGISIEELNHVLSLAALSDKILDAYPDEVSGGQLQRLNAIRSVCINPDILVCDEVTSSLDVVGAERLMQLIISRHHPEQTICFISHDLAVLQKYTERIIVLKEGQVVDDFRTSDLFSPARATYTQQLITLFE